MLQPVSEFPSFLRLNNYCVVCIYHILFIHPSVDGHLGCFHVLATVNNAAINMGVQISAGVPAFSSLVHIPRSGIAGSYGNSMPV